MRQTEINQELRAAMKAEVKARGWTAVRTTLYWFEGPLFFTLILSARASGSTFDVLMKVRWAAVDGVLRRLINRPDPEFELNTYKLGGQLAFLGYGWQLAYYFLPVGSWQAGVVAQQVRIEAQQAAARAAKVVAEVDSLDAYEAFLEREYQALLKRNARTMTTISVDKLAIAILRGDTAAAAAIARDRIAIGDYAHFDRDGLSFYEIALASFGPDGSSD